MFFRRRCLRSIKRLCLYELTYILTGIFFYTMFTYWNDDDPLVIIAEKPNLKLQYYPLSREVLRKLPTHPTMVWWDVVPLIDRTTPLTLQCEGGYRCNIASNFVQLDRKGAYLFYAPVIEYDLLPLPRHPETIWGIYHDETPLHTRELMHDEILRLFNYSSTFSRHSDVPFPLRYLKSMEAITSMDYFVKTAQKNSYLIRIAPVLYIQTRCEDATERDEYVEQLMDYITVDSYGACLRNNKMPLYLEEGYSNNLLRPEFLEFVARYKFVIAIENFSCEDYITEKLWRAIYVGSVPIYFGATNVREWLPNNKSAILIEDYPTPKLLSEHLKKLLANDSLYEEYLEHKIKSSISNRQLRRELITKPYQKDPMGTLRRFQCFVCKKLHSKVKEERIVTKAHLNCGRPLSALTLKNNTSEFWQAWWDSSKNNAERVFNVARVK